MEDTLRALIIEVKEILNSRPLTPVSDLPNDLDVLTPNHLLLLGSNPNVPPGVFQKSDNYCRRCWRQVQYQADLFLEEMAEGVLATATGEKKVE